MSRPVAEKDFQAAVIDYAHLCGWLVYHTYDSRRSQEGFPDLVMVRPPDAIFAEMKSEGGKVTEAQSHWLDWLAECGLIVRVWRPSNWPDIEEMLR